MRYAGQGTSDRANCSPGQVFDRRISPPEPLGRHTTYTYIKLSLYSPLNCTRILASREKTFWKCRLIAARPGAALIPVD